MRNWLVVMVFTAFDAKIVFIGVTMYILEMKLGVFRMFRAPAFPSIILGLSNKPIPKLTNGHAGILFPEPSFRALVVTAPVTSLANLSAFY